MNAYYNGCGGGGGAPGGMGGGLEGVGASGDPGGDDGGINVSHRVQQSPSVSKAPVADVSKLRPISSISVPRNVTYGSVGTHAQSPVG